MATDSTELAKVEPAAELVSRRLEAGLAAGNGVIDPARWQMLAAIAETVHATEFVPAGLRSSAQVSKKPAVLACLLYGDSLGLHPMAALKEVHVIDGVPGLSAAAMAALVRKANPGHRLQRIELRDPETGAFQGVTVTGIRGDTEETDTYTFTLEMATRAGLMSKANWQKYPEAMCSARATSQICTFLFPDVFMGSPLMPEELEGSGVHEAHEFAEEGHVIVKPPAAEPAKVGPRTDTCPIHGVERTELEVAPGRFYCPECKLAGPEGEPPVPVDADANADAVNDAATVDGGAPVVVPGGERPVEQSEWEVADADSTECITYIDGETREQLRNAAADAVVRLEGTDYELVGFEINQPTGLEKLLVRAKPAAPGKPAEGSPEAVVKENIPEILGRWVTEAQQAGNVEFIRGVLNAEKAGKNRGRLVGTLEEIIAGMEADELAKTLAGDGTGEDNPLLEGEHEEPESESAEDVPLEPAEDAEIEPTGFVPMEPDPEPEPELGNAEDVGPAGDLEIPTHALTHAAKVIRLKALCALAEDQFPQQRAWHLAGVIGSGSRQWSVQAHALEDFDDEQLDLIWRAAEAHFADGVKFLAMLAPADVLKMGGAAA